jgi:hypothetical protein
VQLLVLDVLVELPVGGDTDEMRAGVGAVAVGGRHRIANDAQALGQDYVIAAVAGTRRRSAGRVIFDDGLRLRLGLRLRFGLRGRLRCRAWTQVKLEEAVPALINVGRSIGHLRVEIGGRDVMCRITRYPAQPNFLYLTVSPLYADHTGGGVVANVVDHEVPFAAVAALASDAGGDAPRQFRLGGQLVRSYRFDGCAAQWGNDLRPNTDNAGDE